jgi:hypothetical protein
MKWSDKMPNYRMLPDGRPKAGAAVRVVGIAKDLGIKNSMSVFNTDYENVYVDTFGYVVHAPRKGAKTICVTLEEFNGKKCQMIEMSIDKYTMC